MLSPVFLLDLSAINLCFYMVILLATMYSIRHLLNWLVCNTDIFGRYFAMLCMWLTTRLNVTILLEPSTCPTNRKKDVFTLIDSYSSYVYWIMCLDSYRLNAYEEAVRQYEKQQKRKVWIDIGTGAHMPLARLLLKYEVAEHVYAVEASYQTYLHSKKCLEQLPSKEKKQISLHNCFSTDIDWQVYDPRPNAIIHEIVGTISSDEGCIKVMHDMIKNLNGDVSVCIPYQVGTLCVPVSHPKITLLSSLCSSVFHRTFNIIKKLGIQGVVNPPKDTYLCETPQFIEKFVLMEYACMPLNGCKTFQTKFIVDKNEAHWTGFYLAPHILTTKDNENGAAEINGLSKVTNWPVNYVHMFNTEHGIDVKQGDEIHLIFQSDLTDACPTYRIEAWVNNEYLLRTSFAWKGSALI